MRLSAMGDVAMTVPVLRALLAQHPEVRLTVISRPFFAPFFKDLPRTDFFAFDAHKRHKGVLGLLQLYWDLKPLQIDYFADLHNVLRSKFIRSRFAIRGTKTAATDKGRAEKKALTRAQNKVFKPLKTMYERHAQTFAQLGFEIDLSHPVFPKQTLSPETIVVTGIKTQKWVGIAPFAQYAGKVYPQDLMREVVAGLAQENSCKIFLFGSRDEVAQLKNLAGSFQNVQIIAGKLSLAHELELIANLDVMLSMDSGNAHLAAMYGVQVVTLWGATHPYAGFLPFGQPIENALTADRNQYPLLPTSVYGNKVVPGYEDVMRTIRPEKVIQKIKSLLL
ncbi:glycosyltransferase family 9 protein [Flavobacterium sp. CYK-55]|uniref:glycosyltransferase family 9 protein n=1 Tax=Flavobacterium sp. CYK-55 TaxID=2835529 RepID=UPI001BCD737E|nr:glycosyltransferase family 9 protein [Flavobacterium sp. CYK-55]MBS7787535.1 glycosyltransferase family 9 protein [Flavobacterium sp. CYK-55]